MTEDSTPTTMRRQLGARLRQLRVERGKTAQQVADDLGFSISKVSRMESGARAVNEQDLSAVVRYFDLPRAEAEELADAARGGRQRRRPTTYVPAPETDHLAFVRSGFVELERDADSVREFNSGVVPGLLQEPGYMRALMLSSVPEGGETLAKAMALRLDRQQRLGRPGGYEVIVDEAVLARRVGGATVMRQQMDEILKRIDDGAVEFRVIPFSAGPHPGLNSVFVMLAMASSGAPDLVFIEGLVGHQSFERPEDIGRFQRVWSQLLVAAAPAGQSRGIVSAYRANYSSS